MMFLTAQAKALGVGLIVLTAWSALDWLSARHGWPVGQDRNYWDTFFGAVAGASFVYCTMPPAQFGGTRE